ncbi:UNVERIFIED_CONTAM: Ubiquitin-like protein 7 [Gekko kuhli]
MSSQMKLPNQAPHQHSPSSEAGRSAPGSEIHPVDAGNGAGECPLGSCSISYLKQLITRKLQEPVPDLERIDLIYCGWKLQDDQTLGFYGIQSSSTVHVLCKSWPEPDQNPEPVDKMAAVQEFHVLHNALHSSPISWDCF